jgi:hypothetical protein
MWVRDGARQGRRHRVMRVSRNNRSCKAGGCNKGRRRDLPVVVVGQDPGEPF